MVIVDPRGPRPAAAQHAAWFGLGLMLAGCGEVSLGSQRQVGGAGGNAGAGGSGAGQAGAAMGGQGGGLAGAAGSGSPAPPTNDAGGVAGAGAVTDGGADAGAVTDAGAAVDAGLVIEPPSCRGLSRCGAGAGADCCASPPVTGGSFALTVNMEGTRVAVSVSSFRLDRFEVSLARAREFIAGYDAWRQGGEPRSGTGRHPRIADSGWQESFSEQLPESGAQLEQRWRTCGLTNIPLSTFDSAADDNLPLNCVNWYEAFAFCAWDGGRLPTLAELAYAGAGGDENRLYPWGDAPPPNAQRAAFGCNLGALDLPECRDPPTSLVGSRPLGTGRFGQEDLAGSVTEWVLDGVPTLAEPCTDCASLTLESLRSYRGGSWLDGPERLANSWFEYQDPTAPIPTNGIRCARDE